MTDALRVTAVISSYKPPVQLIARVTRLMQQVESVIVVDDGSGADARDVLDGLQAAGADVIVLDVNRGIASALNVGLAKGRDAGADLILTLDQDSELDPGYVDRAVDSYVGALARGVPVGIICAASYNHAPVILQTEGASDPEAFDPMQSGTLIPLSTLTSIGMFEEDLVIDGVDSEYTARLRRAGLKALIAPGCNITHAVGEPRPMRLGRWHVSIRGQKQFVHSHAPFRVYYITRNGLVLYGRYVRDQPRWVLRRIKLEAIVHVTRVIYGPYRRRQLTAVGLGVLDAVRRRSGRLTPHQEALIRTR